MSLLALKPTLLVAAALFALGLYAVLSRRNAVAVLMGIELILNSANLQFAAFSRFSAGALDGQVFAVFVITVAAAEASVALALAVSIYRLRQSIDVDKLNLLKW